MALPARIEFYDAEISASLDELGARVTEDEELSELVARIQFMVKTRSEHLEKWLTESDPRNTQG